MASGNNTEMVFHMSLWIKISKEISVVSSLLLDVTSDFPLIYRQLLCSELNQHRPTGLGSDKSEGNLPQPEETSDVSLETEGLFQCA